MHITMISQNVGIFEVYGDSYLVIECPEYGPMKVFALEEVDQGVVANDRAWKKIVEQYEEQKEKQEAEFKTTEETYRLHPESFKDLDMVELIEPKEKADKRVVPPRNQGFLSGKSPRKMITVK